LQSSLQRIIQDPPTPDVRDQNTIKLKLEDCSFGNILNGARSHTVCAAADSEYPVNVASMLRTRIPFVLLREPKGLFAEEALSARPSTRPTIMRANKSDLEAHNLVMIGIFVNGCVRETCFLDGVEVATSLEAGEAGEADGVVGPDVGPGAAAGATPVTGGEILPAEACVDVVLESGAEDVDIVDIGAGKAMEGWV
jgi:hypothetical protein